jgi:hypothetical protein
MVEADMEKGCWGEMGKENQIKVFLERGNLVLTAVLNL